MIKLKILIIHPGGIGDLVTFTPALKILRNNFPKAIIDIFIIYTPEAKYVLQEEKIINRIFKFNWSKSNFLNKLKFIHELRKEKYDLSIIPTDVNPLRGEFFSFLFGAKVKVGEKRENKKSLFYTQTSLLYKNKKRSESNIDLLKAIGLKINFPLPSPFLDVTSKEREFVDNFLIRNNFENKILIGFHPGCNENQKFRRWPKENFIELGNKILNDLENAFILLFGGPEEIRLCLEIKSKLDKNTIVISGYSLKQVAALIDKCKIFISSDSGLGHIASTTKTNLISIFGPTDYKRAAPFGRERIYVLKEKCRYPSDFISFKNYDKERTHTCLKKITPDRVFNKIKEILGERWF